MVTTLATIKLVQDHNWPKPVYLPKLWHQHIKVYLPICTRNKLRRDVWSHQKKVKKGQVARDVDSRSDSSNPLNRIRNPCPCQLAFNDVKLSLYSIKKRQSSLHSAVLYSNNEKTKEATDTVSVYTVCQINLYYELRTSFPVFSLYFLVKCNLSEESDMPQFPGVSLVTSLIVRAACGHVTMYQAAVSPPTFTTFAPCAANDPSAVIGFHNHGEDPF